MQHCDCVVVRRSETRIAYTADFVTDTVLWRVAIGRVIMLGSVSGLMRVVRVLMLGVHRRGDNRMRCFMIVLGRAKRESIARC